MFVRARTRPAGECSRFGLGPGLGPGRLGARAGDSRRLVENSDDEAWIAAAAAALREDGPVIGVIPFSEPHVRPAALLAEELGLPGPGLRAAWTSRNKYLQRELFARQGLARRPTIWLVT